MQETQNFFKPGTFAADPMFAAMVTMQVKELGKGYDGVMSRDQAEGLVLFNPRDAKLVRDASVSRVATRYLQASETDDWLHRAQDDDDDEDGESMPTDTSGHPDPGLSG